MFLVREEGGGADGDPCWGLETRSHSSLSTLVFAAG